MKNIRIFVEGQPEYLFFKILTDRFLYKDYFPDTNFDINDNFSKSILLSEFNILRIFNSIKDNLNEFCFIIPDLHPINQPFQHNNLDELRNQIHGIIKRRYSNQDIKDACKRLYIHVFKYNFEIILLAEIDKVIDVLGINNDNISVEKIIIKNKINLNALEEYPYNFEVESVEKNILRTIFRKKGKTYSTKYLNPIFEKINLKTLVEKLPHFRLFIKDLFQLADFNKIQNIKNILDND